MAAKRRRRDIQGLRAVAVLLVVAYHAGLPVVCGFLGVDVFFVISGFVITGSCASVFGANFYLSELSTGYFDVAATLNPLQHTWTLGVEEQFYLAFPILILVAWRIGRWRSDRTARLAAAAVVALAAAFSLELARSAAAGQVIAGIGGAQFAFYASPARAWEVGAGAV